MRLVSVRELLVDDVGDRREAASQVLERAVAFGAGFDAEALEIGERGLLGDLRALAKLLGRGAARASRPP